MTRVSREFLEWIAILLGAAILVIMAAAASFAFLLVEI